MVTNWTIASSIEVKESLLLKRVQILEFKRNLNFGNPAPCHPSAILNSDNTVVLTLMVQVIGLAVAIPA